MTRSLRIASALLLLGAAGTPLAASADGEQAAATARVSYVTSRSVYVDAGTAEGLRVGDELRVERDGVDVATLVVDELSKHRALCRIERSVDDVRIGDSVSLPARASGAATARPEPVGAADPEPAAAWSSRPALRGRVGIRLLAVRDATGDGSDFTQPGLDLRLEGERLGGTGLGFAVDARATRTVVRPAEGRSETDPATRVYRLAASWAPDDSPWRFSLGRQFSPSLASVNLFDGVMAEYRGERWAAGAFSGTLPDEELDFSSELTQHGVWASRRNQPGSASRWSLSAGLAGSYDGGEINREALFFQSFFESGRVSGTFAQEVDLNRDWRKELDGDSLSPTSTYAYLRVRLSEPVSVYAGYDDRRRVILLRDRITPETELDDLLRRSVRVGVQTRMTRRWRARLDARTSTGGTSGDADAFSLSTSVAGLGGSGRFGLRLRSTRYENDIVEGWLHAADVGVDLGDRWYVSVGGGARDDEPKLPTAPSGTLGWGSLDVDVRLGGSWFATASFEAARGQDEDNDQAYLTLSYRL